MAPDEVEERTLIALSRMQRELIEKHADTDDNDSSVAAAPAGVNHDL